jgi:hypothetical protein
VEIMDNAAIHRIIVDTLRELGVPNANFSITDTRILVRDGFYVGRRLSCGHVEVVVLACGEKIEFYEQDGSLLRSIQVNQPVTGQNAAA